jgi:predicted permease
MSLSYLDGLQVFCVILAIMLIGFGCGFFKFFTYKEVSAIRRMMTLVAIPAAIFRIIGDHPFNLQLFMSLFNSLLTQATLHVICAIAAFLLPSADRRLTFLKLSIAATRPNYIFAGYPVVQVLFGDSFLYICAMSSIAHFLIIQPLVSIVSHLIVPAPEDGRSDVADITGSPSDPGIKEHLNPEPEPAPEPIEADDAAPLSPDEPPVPPPVPFWRFALFSFVTPINVCTVLGLIWSTTPWTMLAFMSPFVIDLEKSVVASGLFSVGVFLWETPFSGSEKALGAACALAHIAVVPVVSGLWSWVLGVEKKAAAALALVHAAPMAWGCLAEAEGAGMLQQAPVLAFVWSNLLALPVFMLWLTVLNTAGFVE